ncbi:MAG: Hsp70 family protein [Defluviitaleaceae bacterium]|nr:Hsp70 family protein [Defluviitaleaceae bacterium]
MYLGIDLGTTNSVAMIFNDKTNETEPVYIDETETILPSVVNYLEDETIVGFLAKETAIIYPETTIISIKKYIGEEGKILLGTESKTPVEISADILRTLKEAAEKQANTTFDEVVITHPAYFNDRQIFSTKEAGELAGFKSVFLLSEPLAAAIEYGYKNSYAQTILVYDLGGGTFDASILKVNVDEGGRESFTELATVGDMNLGGDDFDYELMNYFKKEFKKQSNIDIDKIEDVLEKKRVLQKLKVEAENTKKKLSSTNKVKVSMNPLFVLEGIPQNLNCEITREDFETLIRKYVDRTREIVEESLKRADRTADQISKVILVGGSTFVPMVKRTVSALLKEPYRAEDPAKSVSMGAAIYNFLIHLPNANVHVQQVTRQILGTMAVTNTETMERELIEIIPLGSPIPITVTDDNFTNMASSVNVNIYQWEEGYEKNRQYLGLLSLEGLEEGADLSLTYELDENNIFSVYLQDKATGKSEKAIFDRTGKEHIEEEKPISNSKMAVNIVFIIDTTGSMDSYINAVKDRAIAFANIIKEKGISYKLGLIGFGDLYEKEKPSIYKPTEDVEKFRNWVQKIPRTYGGDIPESSLEAVETALTLTSQAENIFILITDAPPHVPTKNGKSPEDIKKLLEEKNVTTYVAAAHDDRSKAAYSVIANGKYYNLHEDFLDILDVIAISIAELVRV